MPGAVDPSAIVLRQGGGLRRHLTLTTVTAAFASVSDGDLTARAAAAAIAGLLDLDGDEVRARSWPSCATPSRTACSLTARCRSAAQRDAVATVHRTSAAERIRAPRVRPLTDSRSRQSRRTDPAAPLVATGRHGAPAGGSREIRTPGCVQPATSGAGISLARDSKVVEIDL